MSATRRLEWLVEALLKEHGASSLGDPIEAVSWHRDGFELVLADCGDDTHVSLVAFLGTPNLDVVSDDHLARDLLQHAYRHLADPQSVSFALQPETGQIVSRMVFPYSMYATPGEAAASLNEAADVMQDELATILAGSLVESLANAGSGGESGVSPASFA